MNKKLDEILKDNPSSKPEIVFDTTEIISKLEELKDTMADQWVRSIQPVRYKIDFGINRLPYLKTANEKLILTFLSSVESATTANILDTLDLGRMTASRSISRLVELKYINKVRNGEYSLNRTPIF